jgi:AcrR family transcriptional regulator
MARAALTDDQIHQFRARAVEVATELFAERGYDAVTMRGLATALGCSPMTPYRYFENRDELYAMVRAEAFRRFADRQQAAFEEPGTSTERLLRLKRAYVEFALDEPNAYRIMFQLSQAPAGTYPELAAQGARGFEYLHRAVAQAIEDGVLGGDPLSVAHLLWANTHGLVSLHLAGKLAMGRSLDELAAITLELR